MDAGKMFDPDEIAEKDSSGIREYEFNGKKGSIQRTQPYGFWKIRLEKGSLPPRFDGVYTDVPDAVRALEVYLNTIPVPAPVTVTQKRKTA